MKNKIKSLGLVSATLLSVAFLSTTGPAGCGGGGGASTIDTSASASVEQRQQVALQIISNLGSSSSTNPAGLLLGSDAPALTLDTTVAVPCDSGSATIVVNPGTPTAITYDHCRFGDYTIDGLATITTTSLHHTTITYTNVTYSTTSCGAYGLNGTIGIDSSAASTTTFLPVTVTYGLSTQRGGSVGTITGTVTHNTGDTLSGNMNVTNPNFTCNYSNTALTCPALTSACSLSSASLCNGNDFRTDICSL